MVIVHHWAECSAEQYDILTNRFLMQHVLSAIAIIKARKTGQCINNRYHKIISQSSIHRRVWCAAAAIHLLYSVVLGVQTSPRCRALTRQMTT